MKTCGKGSLSRHKRFKFGCEPGDISKYEKIQMLETGHRETPFGNPGPGYKRDHVKLANRHTRRYPELKDEIWE